MTSSNLFPLSRSPFTWLRERDIDLLLCSELHADGVAARLIARLAGDQNADLLGAWVSHAESDGESDLVVAFKGTQGRMLALIENKIAAEFQPDQAKRYAARAERWRGEEGTASVVTILIAPADYMVRPGAEEYDQQLTYEEVAANLSAERDRRSAFLADALRAGIAAYRTGYMMKPDEKVSDMWNACWELSTRVAPALRFQQPDLKPNRSTWFYFREADGFSPKYRKQVVLVFKAERGQADLQFAGMTPTELLQRADKLLLERMTIVPAGKSASIRIAVPPIDFQGSAKGQEAALTEGFAACDQLRRWYIEHQDRLLSEG